MLEHLLYKALMELCADRAEFLSRLFSRPRPTTLDSNASPEALVHAYETARPTETLFDANAQLVVDHLINTKRFQLSDEDQTTVRYVYRAFFDSGPDLRYTFLGGYGGFMGMPSYGDLMTENDGRMRN
jgi:hypothetical protein